MNAPVVNDRPEEKLKIYFLPNLLTAGNLFCGFVALTKIVEADVDKGNFYQEITLALGFILLACIFDLLFSRFSPGVNPWDVDFREAQRDRTGNTRRTSEFSVSTCACCE